MCNINHTRLNVCRAVEHLPRHVPCAGNNNKLVEHRHTTQTGGQPFLVVLLELGVHGFQEWANEWNFPCRPDKVAFLYPIGDLIVDDSNGEDSPKDGPTVDVLEDILSSAEIRNVDRRVVGGGEDRGGGVQGLHDGRHR